MGLASGSHSVIPFKFFSLGVLDGNIGWRRRGHLDALIHVHIHPDTVSPLAYSFKLRSRTQIV